MNDIEKALLGDCEAQKRVTERGELLPCPFCGGSPEMIDNGKLFGVRCQNLSCSGYDVKPEYGGASYAREGWNTRPALLTQEQIKRLECEGDDAH